MGSKNNIADALTGLKEGDLIKIKCESVFGLTKKDDFISEYISHDSKIQELTIYKKNLHIFDFHIYNKISLSYEHINSIELLEPKKLF